MKDKPYRWWNSCLLRLPEARWEMMPFLVTEIAKCRKVARDCKRAADPRVQKLGPQFRHYAKDLRRVSTWNFRKGDTDRGREARERQFWRLGTRMDRRRHRLLLHIQEILGE